MTYDYDALYRQTPDALGAQTPALETILERFGGAQLSILDVGCGQGRDALPLARAGHQVHGVDLSAAGIAQMVQAATTEGLPVTGEVADLTNWTPQDRFDLVLVDRTLHMLPDRARLALMRHLLRAVRPGGWVLVEDESANIPALQDALGPDWSLEIAARPRFLARRTP